jgi:pimeloyl-ACP methyl ester carboxylesterase
MRRWDESAVQHGYADLDDVRLHYVEAGEGPLVLLVHGFPGFWYSWHHQILPLADAGFRVVAPDTRGTNLSSRPGAIDAYREEILGRDVAQLIGSLGATSAAVAGHDWGGWAAYWAAMLYPERVSHLAVLNVPHPVVFAHARLKLSYQLIRAGLIAPKMHESRITPALIRSTFRRELIKTGAMNEADLDRFMEVVGPSDRRPSANPYRAQHRYRREPIEKRCRPISCPVLVIYGEEDPYMGPELAAPPADWVPNARVERIPGANHRVQMHRPERVTELLLAFLTDESSQPATAP